MPLKPKGAEQSDLAKALELARAFAGGVPAPQAAKPAQRKAFGEDEQVEAAIAMSGASQRTQLEKEEKLNVALAILGLKVKKMRDDGNCLFRALADQIWGDASRHAELRETACAELMLNRAHFEPYMNEDFDVYVATMSCDGTYATQLEIQAFANVFGKQILLYSDEGASEGVIEPIVITSASGGWKPPPVRLTYERGNHYNSIVEIDAPTSLIGEEAYGGGGGNSVCPYCSKKVDDVDLHIVTLHSEMF